MKKLKKITAILLMALMVPLLLSPQAARAAQTQDTQTESKETDNNLTTDNFRVRAVPGLNGYYKVGIPIPVTIYLESRNEDFEGILRVIVPSSDFSRNSAAYEKDVMLTAGSEKAISMSVDSVYNMSAYRLELEDTSGKIVLETDITLKGQTGENVLTGILSNDFTALNYFDGKQLNFDTYTTTTQVVELNPDNFPDQASALEPLGYLIINSFDTSSLSESQYTALKSWVENGGVLIIGTGSDYKQTLSGFQDGFVSGDIGAFQSGELSLGTDESAVSFSENDGIPALSLEGGSPLEGVLTTPELIWDQPGGQGHVVMTAFNLGMEPVSSWGARSEMAQLLLTASASGYSAQRIENLNYGNSVDTWNLQRTLNSLPETAEPNMPLFIILFIVFVFFAGPGLYLILKAADKREWIWVAIPALSIVVMAGVFLLSRNMRITEPEGASVTTLSYDSEKDAVFQKAYLSVLVPGASEEKVLLQNDLINLRLMEGQYDYSWYNPSPGSSGELYAYKTAIRELPEGYLLTIRNGSTFGSSYMGADVVSDSTPGFGLETELSRTVSGIRGTVTNNSGSDLYGVSVYTNNRMVVIGNMKAGESVSFEEADNEFFNAGYVDPYSTNFLNVDDEKLQSDFMNVWNLFCSEYLYSMKSDDVYTFGYLPEFEADYVADEKIPETNVAMMVRRDRTPYEDYPDATSLSLFQYTTGSPQNWDTDGWMYDREVEVAFDVSMEINQIHALIRGESDSYYMGGSDNVTVYGYNFQTGSYDELFTDGDVMKFTDGCPYMDETGTVKMKFISPLTDGTDYAPAITVIGGVQ